MIGHGVLDMWTSATPSSGSSANESGAHEVLEAAIVSNDRISTEALNRAQRAGRIRRTRRHRRSR